MAKRWTEKEDRFIHAHFDGVGAYIGPHDLGRSEKSVTDRAAFLKRTGAWAALTRQDAAYYDYLKAIGVRFADDFEQVTPDA